MKKLLGIMLAGIFGIALSVGSASAASSTCLNVKFNNGDSVCLDVSKNGTKNFKISIAKNNLSKNTSLTCRILLPNSKINPLNKCEGTFSYDGTSTQSVIIYATYTDNSNNSHFKRQQAKINFNNGSWGSSSDVISTSSSSSSSSSSNDDIELSTNRKSPSTNQYVNLTIKTDRNYTGKLYLSAKYRSSSSSSWSSISNTSSTYFNDYSSEWNNEYYKMTSSDRGEVTLSNLVKFRKDGYYRIYVKDTDGNENYIQFSVGDVSSSNEDLKLSISPSDPDTNEWVKLTIKTDDDYTGKINFSKFQYKSSNSSSWSDISRTSSTYVSDYSTEWSNGYYKMTSSDDGEAVLKNLIKFKKSGYYRIYAEDTDGNEAHIQIDVDVSSSSSSNDDIELSTNRKSPSTNQYVNLTIKTDRNYTGKLYLSAKYRSSSSSSWSSISNTSSTYFNDYSSEWNNEYYKMTSSDRGEVTLSNLVKFRKDGYYRIYVKDTDGNENYIQFSVGDSDSSSNDDISVSASPSSPDTSEWVKLTISTSRNYTGKINFSKFQYRSSSSDSWSSISRTSSTYVSDYSSEWSNGYYKMTSSDDGEAVLKNFIKFKKKGYYRIYVKDTDGNESYVQINVGVSSSSSGNSDEIELSTNKKSPSTNQYVNLTINTDDTRYTGKLTLTAKYRSSSSASWSSISNTSSTYFNDYSNDWSRGYYKMTSSDRGNVTLNSLVKFRKDGYYRIYVEDTDGNESYIQFSVGDVDDDDDKSNVNGFTSTQLDKVKKVYKEWNNMVAQMQRQYPSLKKDNFWIKMSDSFYDSMKDVIDNKKSRNFDDYDEFQKAFDDWYKYTLQNI